MFENKNFFFILLGVVACALVLVIAVDLTSDESMIKQATSGRAYTKELRQFRNLIQLGTPADQVQAIFKQQNFQHLQLTGGKGGVYEVSPPSRTVRTTGPSSSAHPMMSWSPCWCGSMPTEPQNRPAPPTTSPIPATAAPVSEATPSVFQSPQRSAGRPAPRGVLHVSSTLSAGAGQRAAVPPPPLSAGVRARMP